MCFWIKGQKTNLSKKNKLDFSKIKSLLFKNYINITLGECTDWGEPCLVHKVTILWFNSFSLAHRGPFKMPVSIWNSYQTFPGFLLVLSINPLILWWFPSSDCPGGLSVWKTTHQVFTLCPLILCFITFLGTGDVLVFPVLYLKCPLFPLNYISRCPLHPSPLPMYIVVVWIRLAFIG